MCKFFSPTPWLGRIATPTDEPTFELLPVQHVESLAAGPDVQIRQPGMMPLRFDNWFR